MKKPASFQLSFRPSFKFVGIVRRFVSEFYLRVLADPEIASRLALATHELLENAVAYAVDGETSVRIEVAGAGDGIVVKTWNRASPSQVAALQAAIDEMNSVPDPEEYYQDALVKTSKRPERSGLGLARVRAEGDMAVSYEIEQGRVCILARTSGLEKHT